MQLVPITTNVVSSNPVQSEVHSMEHFVKMFVSDLRQISGFSGYSGFLRNDITEILLKVALNTITLTLKKKSSHFSQCGVMVLVLM